MMTREEIKKYDRSGMLDLILALPEQIEKAHELARGLDLKLSDRPCKNICVLGMGGSAIGGDVMRSYLFDTLAVPFHVNRHYHLPAFVSRDSLVIACSYSGNTEETLSAYAEASERGAGVICITSGGELEQQARQNRHKVVKIPGGAPPHSALGYLSIPILHILAQHDLIPPQDAEILEAVSVMKSQRQELQPEQADNLSQRVAGELSGKIPLVLASTPHYDAVTLRWKGQFSENSEILAFANVFPELNHNEIMGWGPYAELNRNFKVIYLCDPHEHERIQRRMDISKSIFSRQTGEVICVQSRGETLLGRIFSLIFTGDMVSLYLAILNKVDPTAIENIDFLKRSLVNI